MGQFTGTPQGSRAGANRYAISPAYILKNEPAIGEGVLVKVNSERLKLTVQFPCVISLDQSATITQPGIYIINRPVDNVRIQNRYYDGGAAAVSAYAKQGIVLIETSLVDVPPGDINPDLLPTSIFGLAGGAAGIGVGVITVDMVSSFWKVGAGSPLGDDFDLPKLIFVKAVSCWREATGAQPPVPASFIYGLRLFKLDNLGSETTRILNVNGSTHSYTVPMHNLSLPVRSLYQGYAAEVPFLRWFFDLSIEAVATVPNAFVMASYLR